MGASHTPAADCSPGCGRIRSRRRTHLRGCSIWCTFPRLALAAGDIRTHRGKSGVGCRDSCVGPASGDGGAPQQRRIGVRHLATSRDAGARFRAARCGLPERSVPSGMPCSRHDAVVCDPFCAPEWVEAWFETFTAAEDRFIYTVRDGDPTEGCGAVLPQPGCRWSSDRGQAPPPRRRGSGWLVAGASPDP